MRWGCGVTWGWGDRIRGQIDLKQKSENSNCENQQPTLVAG